MGRKLLQDFKFSDGLVVPKGTHVAVANMAMHGDEVRFDFFFLGSCAETWIIMTNRLTTTTRLLLTDTGS